MSSRLRIGILSFAHLHAEGYIRSLRALPDVEFVGFADDDPERGARFARAFDAHLYPSYDALLADHVDGVVICSENARHLPLIEKAAAARVGICARSRWRPASPTPSAPCGSAPTRASSSRRRSRCASTHPRSKSSRCWRVAAWARSTPSTARIRANVRTTTGRGLSTRRWRAAAR
ncbi:MAG: Gfo/Idh/MocA family oxidoreductase [Anaerolineae bacterium]